MTEQACGGCRVTVDGTMKFACVDGPEFKGNEVNWDEFINRMKQYQEEEAVCFTDRLKEQVEKMARKSRIKHRLRNKHLLSERIILKRFA